MVKKLIYLWIMGVVLICASGRARAETGRAGIELLKNGGFEKVADGRPEHWGFHNFGGQTAISLEFEAKDRNHSVSLRADALDRSGTIDQRVRGIHIPRGTTVRLSGYYRTENFAWGEGSVFRFEAKMNDDQDKADRRWLALGLKPSKEWRFVEKYMAFDVDIESFRFVVIFVRCQGKVWVDNLSLQIVGREQGRINPEERYIWREAEDVARGWTISDWRPEGKEDDPYFSSGRGGAFNPAGETLAWEFKIREEIDEKSLKPIKQRYYIWLRNYGYRQQPQVAVLLDGKKVFEFQTKRTEEIDVEGNYLGGGYFYWQQAGSFSSSGGRHKLEFVCSPGPFFVDAILITTDSRYQPKLFEAREVADKDLFVDVEGAHLILATYRYNGVNDRIVTGISFRLHPLGNRAVIVGEEEQAIFHLSLPQDIKIKNVSSHWSGTRWSRDGFKRLTYLRTRTGERKINGVKVNCYEISLAFLGLDVIVYVQADANTFQPNRELIGEYWLEFGDSKQTPERISILEVDIEPAKAFSQIFIGPSGCTHPLSGADFPEMMKTMNHAGVNFLNLLHNVGHARLSPVTLDLWRDFVREAREHDIYLVGGHSPLHFARLTPRERGVDIEGRKTNLPALGYDGPAFYGSLRAIREMGAFGITGITLNDENYNQVKDKIDYSELMKEGFRGFLREHRPDLSFKDPVAIVRNKDSEKELYLAWVDFKCSLQTSRHKRYREAFEQGVRESDETTTFGRRFFIPIILKNRTIQESKTNTFWDYRLLSEHVTHISPMIYTYLGIRDSHLVGDYVSMYANYVGRNIIAPTLLAGHRGFGEVPLSQKPMIKYQIIESLIHQAPGVIFWTTPGFFNALNLTQVSRAIRLTQPFENIFLEGEPYTAISAEPNWVRVRALKYEDRILLYTANYRNDPTISVFINLKNISEKVNKVTDVAAGKSVELTANGFYTDFRSARGKLFLLDLRKN